MKFCKRYQEYMQGSNRGLPEVPLKKLKRLLKSCRTKSHSQHHQHNPSTSLSPHCPVCDATFFPSLLKEISAVVCCFNEKAKTLLELHTSSCSIKCILWFGGSKLLNNRESMMEEAKDLITYAVISSAAIRKILKKYDKIHKSNKGEIFRSKVQSMYLEILQSPWLCELLAFYINLRRKASNHATETPWFFGDCSLSIDDGKPMLTYGLFDWVNLQIDLSCSICLETVFDPVALRCGHIFCYICCCSAASVTIIDGLDTVDSKTQCPICRRAGVHKGAVNLDELSFLLSQSCPDYWKKRLQTERIERVQQAKEHWESQCRSLMGI
ncbi:putative E3 ubiquitin ligase protein [Dioscorea alata]|uniref:E3 ubiquitin ligase protein n=1 Tax=Dioscorea alata TaxID=55571 RepID=A0ACB7U469_DIOAL|nr:putative E3 ubiquitin ligase protein [Dioscorea alata]